MNLIDVDKLIEDIEKLNLELFEEFKCADSGVTKIISNAQMYIICESVLPRIKEQPTAFDVDKIKKELRSLKQYDNKYDSYYDHTMYMMTDLQNKIVNRTIDKVLEIVKRGGIDE